MACLVFSCSWYVYGTTKVLVLLKQQHVTLCSACCSTFAKHTFPAREKKIHSFQISIYDLHLLFNLLPINAMHCHKWWKYQKRRAWRHGTGHMIYEHGSAYHLEVVTKGFLTLTWRRQPSVQHQKSWGPGHLWEGAGLQNNWGKREWINYLENLKCTVIETAEHPLSINIYISPYLYKYI